MFRGSTSARPPSSMRIGTASRLAAQNFSSDVVPSGQRIGTALGFAGNVSFKFSEIIKINNNNKKKLFLSIDDD